MPGGLDSESFSLKHDKWLYIRYRHLQHMNILKFFRGLHVEFRCISRHWSKTEKFKSVSSQAKVRIESLACCLILFDFNKLAS